MKKIILIALVLFLAFAVIGYRMVLSGEAQTFFENPKEFIFQKGKKSYWRPLPVTLYFVSESGGSLTKEEAYIGQTMLDLPRALFSLLEEGPENKNLNPVVPQETMLIWAKIEKEICVLNVNEAFLRNMPEDEEQEKLWVYGIVNSFAGLSGIEQVKFLVEGKELEQLHALGVKEPLTPDFSFVSNE